MPNYDRILKHIQLSSKKSDLGEIDLLCIKDGKIDVFEVKCSYRIVKARKQLKRIRRLVDFPDMRAFFYCGSSDQVVSLNE